MHRKTEFFGESIYGQGTESVMSSVRVMFPQERDWTCSIASLRTILSNNTTRQIPTEDFFVSNFRLEKGPYNSRQILDKGILEKYSYKVACLEPIPENNQLYHLTELMKSYDVMIECLINYAHWIVLLGYIKLGDAEQDMFIYYDPYYHRVNTIVADELMSMWFDISDKKMHRDYIAIAR